MRQALHRLKDAMAGRLSRPLLIGTVAAVAGSLAAGVAPASATSKKEAFAKFLNCPIETAKLCTYGETLSGEFKMGRRRSPITNPRGPAGRSGRRRHGIAAADPAPLRRAKRCRKRRSRSPAG